MALIPDDPRLRSADPKERFDATVELAVKAQHQLRRWLSRRFPGVPEDLLEDAVFIALEEIVQHMAASPKTETPDSLSALLFRTAFARALDCLHKWNQWGRLVFGPMSEMELDQLLEGYGLLWAIPSTAKRDEFAVRIAEAVKSLPTKERRVWEIRLNRYLQTGEAELKVVQSRYVAKYGDKLRLSTIKTLTYRSRSRVLDMIRS